MFVGGYTCRPHWICERQSSPGPLSEGKKIDLAGYITYAAQVTDKPPRRLQKIKLGKIKVGKPIRKDYTK